MKNFIPDEIIEDIRRSSNIVDIISEYMLLTRKGQNYFGLCPFHGEKTPSFSVNPDKQIFHCFGCGVGGNVFSFIMQKESLSFPEAVTLLADKLGISIPENTDDQWSKEKETRARAFQLNALAKDFYHYILFNFKEGIEAREYLKKRGLTKEVASQFQLGYAPNAWEALKNFMQKKGYSEEELNQNGLVLPRNSQNGFYDRFRHRLMFPIWDVKGNVVGFGGRVMGEGEPKYLNSPETFIYNKRANLYGINFAFKFIREQNQAIIVEGYLDVITAHQYGIKNVVAPLGTALTKEQVKLIMRYTHEVVVAFDADPAGISAALRGIEVLQAQGCRVKVLTIPNGKDPDEFLHSKGSEAFKKLISKALPLVEYKLEKAIKDHGLNSPEAKVRIVEDLAKDLLDINSEVERELYVKKVADTLGLQAETVIAEVRKQQSNKGNYWQYRDKYDKNRNNTNIDNKHTVEKKEVSFSARTKAEAYLLRMTLESPELWLKAKDQLGIDYFSQAEYIKIAEVIDLLLSKNNHLESAEIYNYLQDNSSVKALNDLLTLELPLENFDESFNDCLVAIEKERTKERKELLLSQISKAEKNGDFRLIKELMVSLKELQ